MRKDKIVIGTRSSRLALWQADFVKAELEKKHPSIIFELKHVKTKGDKIIDIALTKIGDKGIFTKELENELLTGTIDIAVHSIKDLQTDIPHGLIIAAYTQRACAEDALIAKEKSMTLDRIPENGKIATGSLRRKAQLLYKKPNLEIFGLRGNVNTRIQKFLDSDWDAIVLARAGLERIGLDKYISSIISKEDMLPAVGQGALGIEVSEENKFARDIVNELNDCETECAVRSERSFLRFLGGGCQTPVAAYAYINSNELIIDGLVCSLDGKQYFRQILSGKKEDAEPLGEKLAQQLLNSGASEVLKEILST